MRPGSFLWDIRRGSLDQDGGSKMLHREIILGEHVSLPCDSVLWLWRGWPVVQAYLLTVCLLSQKHLQAWTEGCVVP
jgi:hypothetical protein